ncbi:MAG: Pls/PosA family non-ribosomal peptide synthetase [Solirubrobacteraceae bacterium]
MKDSLLDGGLRPRGLVPDHGEHRRAPAWTRTLIDVFAETVARCRTRTAIDAPDGRLTYEELSDVVHVLGRRLRSLGIGPGDRVGVRVPSGTADLYVAILGALHAGAAYVPVDADDPEARATSIWQSARVCAVIEAGLRITERGGADGGERELTDADDAWVIFTSGSTGTPKGVAVSHRSATAFVDAETHLWSVRPRDRVLAGLSVAFDASCEEMWLAWRNGAALVPAPRSVVRAAAELGSWLAHRRVTVVSTVPTLAAMWDDSDLAGVRLLIFGGEACPDALAWRLAEGREVWNTYGPTEATVVTTATRLRPGEPVTIGWPLRGWEVAIVDQHGESVALGEPGELVVGGAGLGRYIDPALDAASYAPLRARGWARAYRTGDLVRATVSGIIFVGRRDDQVKLGGRRLELGEIDSQLSSVAGVKVAAAAVKTTAAGNPVLVGYVAGNVDAADVRRTLRGRLPAGIVPLIVKLDALPMGTSGKVDRTALPWPPPAEVRCGGTPAAPLDGSAAPLDGTTAALDGTAAALDGSAAPLDGTAATLDGTAAWLADRWVEQLGPLAITAGSDFFALGGSSLAAAKLVSVLRARFPSVAVADVYRFRTLQALADRLDGLQAGTRDEPFGHSRDRRRGSIVQLAGVFALLTLSAPQWLLGIMAADRLWGAHVGPVIGWGWLIAGWVVFGSTVGRSVIVVAVRRLLLPDLRAGRYPRRSWLTCRLWFLERLSDTYRSESLAGTPFAARYARLCGHPIAAGARLGTLPPLTSLVRVGEGATLEADVDLHGWWLEGDQLVVGELSIGAGARVGTRTLLAPGVEIGAGAEIEPGSYVTGNVPAGERWGGSPAARIGSAGEDWPAAAPPAPHHRRLWRSMYTAGLVVQALLPLVAAAPGLLLLFATGAGGGARAATIDLLIMAPAVTALFLLTYALVVAGLVRWAGSRVAPGWHNGEGRTGWAVWFSGELMAGSRTVLRPLYLSVYTRGWLRLAGIPVGRRAEVSTVVGLNRLSTFADGSFATDDVVFVGARARDGWLHVDPIEVGSGTFLGNSSVLRGGTTLGVGGLVGVLTTPPTRTADGTSWFGSPALELPRIPDCADPARTTNPPRRLVIARGATEMIRILLPGTVSVALAALVYYALVTVGGGDGILAMAAAAPTALLAAGFAATSFTVAAKWVIMGRYTSGEHPFWSWFVWRDEIINSLQEDLARPWLLGASVGTPLLTAYLRAMGAKVGRDVWFECLNVTEFDVVELGDGCVVNRAACVETHLFHDRLMRIGPATLAAGATLGPYSVVLPDTVLGAGVRVGGRSVVLRGEELPPGTSWHGLPVASA